MLFARHGGVLVVLCARKIFWKNISGRLIYCVVLAFISMSTGSKYAGFREETKIVIGKRVANLVSFH